MLRLALALLLALPLAGSVDETDRSAFRAWFTYLADAQFERRTPDVVDCAALVRHAYREALRPHSAEWYRHSALPLDVSFPDVRHAPVAAAGNWPLFLISRSPDRYAEFADAATIVRLNTRPISRDPRAAQPGDLLYFHQPGLTDSDSDGVDHLMVFVGASKFDPARQDWVVYHTGPEGKSSGEVRKVSLADLQRHPSTRWRPDPSNPAFVGVFRLAILNAGR